MVDFTLREDFGDKDLEFLKFVKYLDEIHVRVLASAESALPVFLLPENVKHVYSDISSLAASTLTTIVSYTVPVGKTFKLLNIEGSGNNKARYEVYIGGSLVNKKRAYFTNYNSSFLFNGLDVLAGVTIELRVEHTRPSVGDFEGCINGYEV